MQTPAHITFRHMPPSPAAEARIREAAVELEQYYDRITSCHVTIDAPHKHRQHGARTYHVGIEISVPGSRIVVSHEPSSHARLAQGGAEETHKHDEVQADHTDVYVAIRDSFAKAKRQLEDYARVLRGDTGHPAGKESRL